MWSSAINLDELVSEAEMITAKKVKRERNEALLEPFLF